MPNNAKALPAYRWKSPPRFPIFQQGKHTKKEKHFGCVFVFILWPGQANVPPVWGWVFWGRGSGCTEPAQNSLQHFQAY